MNLTKKRKRKGQRNATVSLVARRQRGLPCRQQQYRFSVSASVNRSGLWQHCHRISRKGSANTLPLPRAHTQRGRSTLTVPTGRTGGTKRLARNATFGNTTVIRITSPLQQCIGHEWTALRTQCAFRSTLFVDARKTLCTAVFSLVNRGPVITGRAVDDDDHRQGIAIVSPPVVCTERAHSTDAARGANAAESAIGGTSARDQTAVVTRNARFVGLSVYGTGAVRCKAGFAAAATVTGAGTDQTRVATRRSLQASATANTVRYANVGIIGANTTCPGKAPGRIGIAHIAGHARRHARAAKRIAEVALQSGITLG